MPTRMKKILVLSLFCFTILLSFSQSVGIGTTTPDPSAQLDVFSNDKGFLPPRIALTSIDLANPISNPATGLLVFNTATSGNAPNNVFPGYYYWNGSAWSKVNQDNSPNLNGVIIRNFNQAVVQNTVRKLTVPLGRVWKINSWTYPGQLTFGDVPFVSTGAFFFICKSKSKSNSGT